MDINVDGKRAFAATGGQHFEARKPTVVFVHGGGLDHTVWALQTRYFAYHGRNVLAVDLPGHGKSDGPPLDSIPAVLAVAPEPFIVFTSNIFAILGLRSLYFVLETAVQKFGELRYALAVVLAFIGAKMILHHWWKLPTWLSLGVIVLAIGTAVTVSLVRRRFRSDEGRLDD